ncbi:MAG: LysM peptidoglycan-binding domain-containing protein [Pseudomonadales bacterium]|nr:LysM peptidoglycan-binding domain-containing protein [Pseudomonadales bacterium]NIX07115.1 LysM peptidoglycan-binding domain-containing protein [Pseudomonadales bacterium]
MKSKLLVSAFLLLCYAPLSSAGKLDRVRLHEAPDHTRVVFDVAAPVKFSYFTLRNPDRVVIDLKNTTAGTGFDPAPAGLRSKRVKNIRVAPRGRDYRVVLDVSSPLKPKAFALEPVAPYGHRLVLDLFGAAAKPAEVAAPKADDKRDVVVAIDAGHGGEDPGALGPGRVREKDVVLKIARKLEARLNATKGYKAFMVRDGDYYIALRKRVHLARRARADLFVSIHADSFRSPEVSGASVYTLSSQGASSETARWMAEKENRSDLIGGVGGVSLDHEDDLLNHVLLDLTTSAKQAASHEAAKSVLGQMARVTKLHKSRVEQAGFAVLKSPDVPSLLVETGYISNPAEANRLASTRFQNKIADALFEGVRSYLSRSAPPGTFLAWQRESGPVRYTIERGDTLSDIAVRYGTSTRRLREANGIAGDRIRVGQVIVIPAS